MLRHFSTSPNTFCWPLLYFAISCVKTFCPSLNSTSDTTQFPTASTLCCWRVFLSDPLFPPNQCCSSIAATTVSSRRASTQQRWFSGVRGGIAVRMEVEVPLIPAPSRGVLHSFLARIKAYRAKTFTSLNHNFDPPGRGTLPAALSAQQAHPHMLSANPALESLILWHVQLPAFQVPKSVPLFPSKNGFARVCPDSIYNVYNMYVDHAFSSSD